MANSRKSKKPSMKRNFNKNSKFKRTDDAKRDEALDSKQRSRTNDVQWYAQNPELLLDAASLPFSQAAGTPFSRNVYADGYAEPDDEVVPGIQVLTVVPVIGDVNYIGDPNPTSPLNIAAMAQYSFVRHANSGSANYTAPNLMMYCMAVAQVYSYINFLQRIYGTCQLYAHYNRYFPKAVIQAQGVVFEDLIENLANFRYGVNSLIRKAASFACPANMTYFQRLAFLFSGIYSEGESIKDQLYMYVPEGFLILTEQDTTPGWALKFNNMPGSTTEDGLNGLATTKDLINFGNSMLAPLLMSEDINIISGDILKAFGSGGILSLATLPEVYEILPTTDLTVLEQMQNADFIGSANWLNANKWAVGVKEDPNTNSIMSTFNLEYSSSDAATASIANDVSAVLNNHILTTILTQPGPGDVIERTRMMCTAQNTSANSKLYMSLHSGSEIVVRCTLYRISPVSGFATKIIIQRTLTFNTASIVRADILSVIAAHCSLENFKFHPTQYYVELYTDNLKYLQGAAIDIDNYTVISDQTLSKMNEAALLSLFAVPNVAKVN